MHNQRTTVRYCNILKSHPLIYILCLSCCSAHNHILYYKHYMANLLTIDDDSNVRITMQKGLSSLGHNVLEAENGRKGLRLAYWRKIDAILLDISMPGMNGLTVLRKLKSSTRTQHIPVLMITGHDDPELKDQACFDYADNYIIKTASIREINDKILAVLNHTPKLPSGWPTMLRW